jgi:hypothetical protein
MELDFKERSEDDVVSENKVFSISENGVVNKLELKF